MAESFAPVRLDRHNVAADSQMLVRRDAGKLMLGAISTTFW